MRQISNHRKGTGRNQNAKLNIDADALQNSLKVKALERIDGYRAKLDELLAANAPAGQVAVIENALKRTQAQYAA